MAIEIREKKRLRAQIHILNDWMNSSAFKLGQNYRKR